MTGYSSVIYLAEIMSMEVELYESAEIDGAGVSSYFKEYRIPYLIIILNTFYYDLRYAKVLSIEEC